MRYVCMTCGGYPIKDDHGVLCCDKPQSAVDHWRSRALRAEAERDDLREHFDMTIVWAARYAHGRSTYAPQTVRDAVNMRKKYQPDWKPRGRVGLRDVTTMLAPDDLRDVFPAEDAE